MPTPDHSPPPEANMGAFAKLFERQAGQDLAYEVAELRREIMLLRAELAPVPSLIITGQNVLDEFRRIKVNRRVRK